MESINEALNRLPEEVIKLYLYSQADLVALEGQNGYLEPVKWAERYLGARQKLVYAENALNEKMNEMGVEVNKKKLAAYLMEKAIFYCQSFRSAGLFPVSQGKLEFLIITTLEGKIRPFILNQAINVVV